MLECDRKVLLDVAKDLGRDEQSLNEDVETIKAWMHEQPHFPEILDTRTVENFLHLCKFSIEKTKQKIDRYFTSKSALDEIYGEINPKLLHMREFRNIASFVILPQHWNNWRVVIFKMKNKHLSDKLEAIDVFRYVILGLEIRLRKDVICGDVVIADCTDIPLTCYLKFTPTLLYKFFVLIYEKIYSHRLKGLYVTNVPPIGERILKLVQKIAKPKIFQRIHVLPNNEALLRHIPENFLPPELGGTGISLDKLDEMCKEELENHQELFDHLDTIRVDESLRPQVLKNDEYLGYHGNFKKIDFD